MQSYKADEIKRFPMSFRSDLNHMLQKMPVSTHVHHRNLCKSLGKNHIPSSWKRAVRILIYKKDSTDNPANFRPITLEPVALKIFTSSLRNKICAFLRQNNFIESHIQKGFVHNRSGRFKHTAHLAYVINNARVKQRSLHVTLLDLKNAFGEANHNLLDCVFEYHHIPIKVRTLVRDLYTDFQQQ